MKDLKTEIEIPDELWKKLIDHNNKMQSVQQFVEKVVETGTRMQQATQEEARQTWEEIAKLGVDIRAYGWAPDTTKPVIKMTHIFHR